MKIGIVYGNPETTTGGGALKFYSSIRLEIRPQKKIEKKGKILGNEVKIKVVKNKVAAPFKVVNTCIMFGVGIYKEAEILQCLIEKGEIIKAGKWYQYKDKKFQGMEQMTEYIKENPKLFSGALNES